jgi:fumarylpyruvate hydrolase
MLAEEAYLFTPQIAALPIAGATSRFPVRRLYCVGRNYVSHIREMKEGDERDPPFFFQKPADALVFDGGTVPYPPATADFQYEVELVVAIGTPGAFIPLNDALKHVYGYAIGIDMTRRDLQREARQRQLPWEPGKSFDHSAPCGPLFAKEDVGNIASGAISLSVNGVPHQQADLKQMIWNVAEIIANLSKQYRLEPGDLIFTGTPAGVGPVNVNDRIEATIAGLGSLSVTITSKEV